MFLNISKKLQVLLRGVMVSGDMYLVVYSDTNWAILNYWTDGAFAFDPQKEDDNLYEQIGTIVNNGKVGR